VFGPAVCSSIAIVARINGREPTADDMEPLSWALWNICKDISSVDAFMAELMLENVAREIVTWTAQYDVLVTPSLAEAPVELGVIESCDTEHPMRGFSRSGRFTPFTAVCNVTGSPAVSIPLYQNGDGLPLGVQLIGQPAQEGALLALAAQVEDAHPWADRRPSLAVT
jgi:amidase